MQQPPDRAVATEVARLRQVEHERAVEILNPAPHGRTPVRVPWPPAWVVAAVPLEEWAGRRPLRRPEQIR